VALETEEALDLCAQSADPLLDRLAGVERALSRRARVSDQPRGASDQSERLVPRELQAPKQEELDEVPEMQARRRRVEPTVVRDRVPGEKGAQRLLIGGHVDEAAPDDLIPHVLERGIDRLRSS